MKLSFQLFSIFILLAACAETPKTLEKERLGYRHSPSRTLFPPNLGNYSFLEHDAHEAIKVDDKVPSKTSAIYLDYKSGGEFSSILYRAFAKVETLLKPKQIKFQEFTAKMVKEQLRDSRVLSDNSKLLSNGQNLRELKVKTGESFLSYNHSGVRFMGKLPAETKLIFIEKGDYVIFLRTAYPEQDAQSLAKPNREFIDGFIKAQM